MTQKEASNRFVNKLPEFKNRFIEFFPGDAQTANYSREVTGALYSEVNPAPVRSPQTLICAEDVAESLGLSVGFRDSQEFSALFSGNLLTSEMRPFATRYGGHQFGNWAGQLGDGRVINLGDLLSRDGHYLSLQLKGAGPTPYSRGGDGRAVLRSSIREFLCSEAMFHLGVPSSRALSLVLSGETVIRDMFYDGNPEEEPGAIVCRVAPSFTRFGNFELCAYRGETDLLRQLLLYTLMTDFPHLYAPFAAGKKNLQEVCVQWFSEVCKLTADMIVHWMRVGFVHGVMNTDNMSILGLTIDYGPYGWIDNYDPDWTPNTTDSEQGRYRFSQQANVGQWNLYQLARALLCLLDDPSPLEEQLADYTRYYKTSWQEMMLKKLGLEPLNPEVDRALLGSLEKVLNLHETDMTIFFRQLAEFDPSQDGGNLVAVIEPALYNFATLTPTVRDALNDWGQVYGSRRRMSSEEPEKCKMRMNTVNPNFVLRNYLVQQAIDQAHEGDYRMLHELYKALMDPYAKNVARPEFLAKRPEWARHRAGCSMLSCSS